jgi:uncharacterized membrane protein
MKILTIMTLKQVMGTAKNKMGEQRGVVIWAIAVLLVLGVINVFLNAIVFNKMNSMGVILFILLISTIIYVMQTFVQGFFMYIYRGQVPSLETFIKGVRYNLIRRAEAIVFRIVLLSILASLFVLLLFDAVGYISGFKPMFDEPVYGLLAALLALILLVIKFISYSFTYYLAIEFPNIKRNNFLKLSMKLTKGHKWQLFIKDLFFGIIFLLIMIPRLLVTMFIEHIAIGAILAVVFSIIAFFILIAIVVPYYLSTSAGYYTEILDEALKNGRVTYEELGIKPEAYIPTVPEAEPFNHN